jgi:enoyl-CoA hydratase/carnithine racemase
VGAEEAHELGLLDYALPAESALEEGLEVARNIAQVPECFFFV